MGDSFTRINLKKHTYAWSIKVSFPSKEILNMYSTGLRSELQLNDTQGPESSEEFTEVALWFKDVRTCPTATKQLSKFELSSKSSSLLMFIFDVGQDFKYPVKCITV